MAPHPIVASVSLVINLAALATDRTTQPALGLAPLLQSLKLSATCVIGEPRQAEVLVDQQLVGTGHELALTVSARSPQRLRSELANLQAAVIAASGQAASVLVGDPQQLRSRAALLADLGVQAVVSGSTQAVAANSPRPLPCGLWQFDCAQRLPQARSRWYWIPKRRRSVKQLLGDPTLLAMHRVVAIDLEQLSGGDFQGIERFLRDLADAERQRLVKVATISEIAAGLATRHEVKPQRSILRRVA